MNISTKCNWFGPYVVAIALAAPAGTALAESADVVTTRTDATVQEFGRDSGNAYWQHREPISPPEPIVKAYDKTKELAVSAIDKTKEIVAQPPSIPPNEPQRFGRAGGFAGLEKFQVPQPGVTALSSSPANATAVKSGEAQWGYSADSQMKRTDESASGQNQVGDDRGSQ